MFKTVISLFKDEGGATVTEYALILGLLLVAAVAILATLGGLIEQTFGDFESALSSALGS